jgi:hypothetical protein
VSSDGAGAISADRKDDDVYIDDRFVVIRFTREQLLSLLAELKGLDVLRSKEFGDGS